MRYLKYILFFLILNSCSTNKNVDWNCVQIDPGNLAFIEMKLLIGSTQIDTGKIKAVKIYSYKLKKDGTIKDSTLIQYQDIYDFSTEKAHTTYKIKYDSLGRDFERYATSTETGKTHLNYRKKYNFNSNLVEWTVFNNDGKVNSRTFYYYDSLYRLIKTEKYYGYFLYEKPILERRSIFEYDGQNLIKETEFYSVTSSGKFDSKLIHEYNNKGQTINYRSETIENETLISYWGIKSFYNDQNLIKEQKYGSDNRRIVTEYKYNSLNLPIENYSFDLNKNKPISLIKYFYQENKKLRTTAVL